jgi:hypothetical protein
MGVVALGFGSARAAPRRSDAGIPSYELFLHFVFFCHGIKSTWYISDFMSFFLKKKNQHNIWKSIHIILLLPKDVLGTQDKNTLLIKVKISE